MVSCPTRRQNTVCLLNVLICLRCDTWRMFLCQMLCLWGPRYCFFVPSPKGSFTGSTRLLYGFVPVRTMDTMLDSRAFSTGDEFNHLETVLCLHLLHTSSSKTSHQTSAHYTPPHETTNRSSTLKDTPSRCHLPQLIYLPLHLLLITLQTYWVCQSRSVSRS